MPRAGRCSACGPLPTSRREKFKVVLGVTNPASGPCSHPGLRPANPNHCAGQGIGFDYSTVVQPVLDRHCVPCHSGPSPAAKVDLCSDKTDFFNVSYELLARGRRRSGEAEWESPYVSWIPTYNGMEQNILEITPEAWGSPRSRLAELLLNGHPGADGNLRLQISGSEIRRLLAWIDLNVPYYGTSETAYPERKGCCQIYPADVDPT
jgi:hypothetical protein